MFIFGIPRIFYAKVDDEWIVETESKVLAHPVVDTSRTTTIEIDYLSSSLCIIQVNDISDVTYLYTLFLNFYMIRIVSQVFLKLRRGAWVTRTTAFSLAADTTIKFYHICSILYFVFACSYLS